MQRFLYPVCVLYQPDRDVERTALVGVLAGNMEKEMLLTALFNSTEREREIV